MKKIVMTGGGTAGHVTPNIALMPALKEAGYDINFGEVTSVQTAGTAVFYGGKRFLTTAFHQESCADTLTGRTLQTRSAC